MIRLADILKRWQVKTCEDIGTKVLLQSQTGDWDFGSCHRQLSSKPARECCNPSSLVALLPMHPRHHCHHSSAQGDSNHALRLCNKLYTPPEVPLGRFCPNTAGFLSGASAPLTASNSAGPDTWLFVATRPSTGAAAAPLSPPGLRLLLEAVAPSAAGCWWLADVTAESNSAVSDKTCQLVALRPTQMRLTFS